MYQKWYNMEYEIILRLIGGRMHLRGIAKELKVSHSTVERKLNNLVKCCVLDYKKEGKNKVFYLKKNLEAQTYVFNAERYNLIKLVKLYPELGIIIEGLLKECQENLIILFGSYAKFAAKNESDIDIYVETKNKKVKDSIEFTNSKIKVKIGDFDLDSNLIKEIIKNHIILRGVEDFYGKTRFFQQA
ncbi:MAG: nucleotidyltransferase domain-containing protein [Candidatus Aenigmarchaeota archaeon]|nr:nucleotidyltransferase domain-containing protein [Candidatus Aenigmarchaeota archaeon]